MLRIWKRKVRRSFCQWFERQNFDPIKREVVRKEGIEAMLYANATSWWNWDKGSKLFFWRWPKEFFNHALFGEYPRLIADPPVYFSNQMKIKDPKTLEQVQSKIELVPESLGLLFSFG